MSSKGSREGDWIRILRTIRGISQRDMTDRVGFSQGHLSNLETGRIRATREELARLARELKPTAEDLERLQMAIAAVAALEELMGERGRNG
jgi:transcriptional regulator with XRE-family HTH domain